MENKYLLTKINNELSGVKEAITKFEHHPSVLSIKENVKIDLLFSFSGVNVEIKCLNKNKAGTFMNIPAKQLIQALGIISEPLMHI